MKRQSVRRTSLLVSVLALFAVLLGNTPLQVSAWESFPKPTFNDKGELLRPDISYREWVYMAISGIPNR
jgi:hypothetical protein